MHFSQSEGLVRDISVWFMMIHGTSGMNLLEQPIWEAASKKLKMLVPI